LVFSQHIPLGLAVAQYQKVWKCGHFGLLAPGIFRHSYPNDRLKKMPGPLYAAISHNL
jgi:hypothetical protein